MTKVLILTALLALTATQASAYNRLVSCKYEYNRDFHEAVYVGTYRSSSGRMYSQMFPTSSYSWCPSSI